MVAGLTPPRLRWLTLLVVGGLGVFVHLDLANQLLPDGAVGLLSRNSESYLFVVLMIIDLELVAPDPRRRRPLWLGWIAANVAAWLATINGEALGLSPSIITLNEPIAALVLLSIYLRWSRMSPRSASRRLLFYGSMAALVVLGEALPGGLENGGVAAFLVDNAETFGMATLGAFLLDFIHPWANARKPLGGPLKWVWYLFLFAAPVVYTYYNPEHTALAGQTGLVDSGLAWLQRVTEAFVAAAILTIYLDLQHRRGRRHGR